MRRLNVWIFFLVISACQSKPNDSKEAAVQIDTLDVDLKSYINDIRKDYQIGGAIAVGVVRDGAVLVEEVFGYADFENQQKADKSTQFYIASMTKSFIGVLIKDMEERGELSLQDPISKYLTIRFSDEVDADQISIEDLLTHTSGLRNDEVAIKTAYTGHFTKEEIKEDFEKYTVQEEYGAYRYTNIGYILAGMIVEEVTDKSWKLLLEERIFTPLGMEHTSAYLESDIYKEVPVEKLARPHSITGDSVHTGSMMKRNDTMHAAGGLISTIGDMNKWLLAHLTKELWSEEMLDAVHTDRTGFYNQSAGINNYGYGLGWTQGDWQEYTVSWHSGGYPGYVSVHVLVPEENLGIVILMNQQSRAIQLILNFILANQLGVDLEILNRLEEETKLGMSKYQNFKDSLFQATNRASMEIPNLEEYTGRYINDKLEKLRVQILNGQLTIHLGNLMFSAEYLGDDRFLIKSDVDDSFGVVDFFHVRSSERRPYLDLFGQEFYKGQNN